MYTELRKIEFYLPGCNSLKEKRTRLRGIKDKFGKNSNLALVESAFQNHHSRAIWSFVSIGQTKSIVDSVLNSVEIWVDSSIDAYIVHVERHPLA